MLDVVYRDARGRLTKLVGALTGEQLRTPVPATSAWTVHELVAHLVGGAADTVSGDVRGPNLAADIICHEGDLHEALGLPDPTATNGSRCLRR